jgi:hypothetical protein
LVVELRGWYGWIAQLLKVEEFTGAEIVGGKQVITERDGLKMAVAIRRGLALIWQTRQSFSGGQALSEITKNWVF